MVNIDDMFAAIEEGRTSELASYMRTVQSCFAGVRHPDVHPDTKVSSAPALSNYCDRSMKTLRGDL